MGLFNEWMNEQKELESLIESAGNLKGLPKNIIKRIVSRGDAANGFGGENSEIKLFKKDAKQSDLTAACKLTGGFVKPGDEGYRSKSRAELEAEANSKAHAGVLVKINDEWAFYAALTYNNKYNLVSSNGIVNKDSYYTVRGRRYPTETDELTAGDLSDFINFKEDKVDIYLVTSDVERELKRQERAAVRGAINDVKKITPERKKAIVEFLKKRSGGVINELVSDIQTSTDSLNKIIESSINRAINGEEKDYTGDFKKITDELYTKLGKINSLGYHIAGIVKEGRIKDNWGQKEDTYYYKSFKNLISEFEKSDL